MGVDPDENARASAAAATAIAKAVVTAGDCSMPNSSESRGRKRQVQARTAGHAPAMSGIIRPGYCCDVSNDNNFQGLHHTEPQLRPQFKHDCEHEPGVDGFKTKRAKMVKTGASLAEKRLRRFRPKQPTTFDAVYERATTQRFFVLSRTLCGTNECPEMHLEVSGSTGNIYNVVIARQPTCDCPHARGGNQCKHTVFVMKKVLRAKHHYVYQLALLSEELRDIFASCPRDGPKDSNEKTNGEDKSRKPVEGDCPICFEEMSSRSGSEALVWCKAACGQNIHRQCFTMWAATKRQASKVTCPYCRSLWEDDHDELTAGVELSNIKKTGSVNADGYINIANQLGISTQRDHSTYHRFRSGHRYAYRR